METNLLINKPSPKFQDVSIAPMHTAEHLLNATMVKTFGCPRSRNAHEEAKSIVDLSKLPENASEILRIVRIGDYDACACIGQHVENTSEIGLFKIISYDYADGKLRLRFKLIK